MAKTWRFNFGGKKFEFLPKPINLDESSDIDDISEPRAGKPVYIPKLKKRKERGESMEGSEISSMNYSTYSPARKPVGETTREQLEIESQRLLLMETADHCNFLKRQRDELAAQLRRMKVENKKKIIEMQERNEETATRMERSAGVLRVQLMEKKKELNEKKKDQQADSRFIEIKYGQEQIDKTIQSFKDCNESISSLVRVLGYSPLSESEFDVVLSTGSFESPMGKAVVEFIDAAKSILTRGEEL